MAVVHNVFFQVIDSGGNFLYPEMGLQVNTLAPGNDVSWSDSYANYPTLCVFDNNSCLTVWGSRMSRTDGQDLYYRRINADGNLWKVRINYFAMHLMIRYIH